MKIGLWLLLGLVALGSAVLGYRVWERREHLRQFERVTSSIDHLRTRCPPKVSKKEWSYQTDWLRNLASNCLPLPRFVPTQALSRFADDLEKRFAGEVDLRTVDWIWDEVARISTVGPGYSERYRPTSTESRLREGFAVDPSTAIERKK